MPDSLHSRHDRRKASRKAAWVALEEPVTFMSDGRMWVVQDYHPLLDMFLCESRSQTGHLAVWIVRYDQIAEHISDIPGIRTHNLE